jgi:hypothetical protein
VPGSISATSSALDSESSKRPRIKKVKPEFPILKVMKPIFERLVPSLYHHHTDGSFHLKDGRLTLLTKANYPMIFNTAVEMTENGTNIMDKLTGEIFIIILYGLFKLSSVPQVPQRKEQTQMNSSHPESGNLRKVRLFLGYHSIYTNTNTILELL